MADPVELRMSVTSIKRVDPYVKDILATSTHVALYKFNSVINEWERTQTEGVLFLYSRSGKPWHSIMIMNRLNTDNLIEPIVKEFEHQMQSPFLLYRNPKNIIYGIWFYNIDDCGRITCLIETLMDNLREKMIEKTKKKDNGVDIFSMLSKAQEDFNNKTPVKGEVSASPQYSSTPRAPDVTSQSVMDFFAKASTKPVKAATVDRNAGENLLQRLMSNPAHSVEHIEKQQRAVTPQEQVPLRPKATTRIQPDRKSMPICFSKPSTTLDHRSSVSENGGSIFQCTSPHLQRTSPLASFLTQTHNLSVEDRDVSRISPLATFLDISQNQKPQLMPPNMFVSSCTNKSDVQVETFSQKGLIKKIEPLTKNQLQQALICLLDNDDEFLTKLHEAYVKTVNEKLNHISFSSVK